MSKVHITGWHPGLQKVTAIKYLVQDTPYGLKEAKDCIDKVVDGGQVTIPFASAAKAKALAAKLEGVGAVVRVEVET